jgi:hypothetical protein
MKKLLSIAVAGLATSVLAATSTTIGVTEVVTTNKSTIVAVPFTSLVDGGNISAKDLVKTAGLPENTQMFTYVGGTYSMYLLVTNTWVAANGASTAEGVSYGVPAENLKLVDGSALWIVLPSAPAPDVPQKIYIYGQWKEITSQTAAVGANLLANPLQTVGTITITSPVTNDILVVANDSGNPDRYTYSYKKSTKAYGWVKGATFGVSLPTFAPGCGFWYLRAGGTAATISWQ